MLGVHKELSEGKRAIEVAYSQYYNQYYLESDAEEKQINTTNHGSKICISYGNGEGYIHFIVEVVDLNLIC